MRSEIQLCLHFSHKNQNKHGFPWFLSLVVRALLALLFYLNCFTIRWKLFSLTFVVRCFYRESKSRVSYFSLPIIFAMLFATSEVCSKICLCKYNFLPSCLLFFLTISTSTVCTNYSNCQEISLAICCLHQVSNGGEVNRHTKIHFLWLRTFASLFV